MVKCPNWKFCHRQMPFDMLDCFDQRCSECGPEFGRNFQFVEAKGDCPVCFETSSDRMVFPGCPGGHCFCINCVKTALFGSYPGADGQTDFADFGFGNKEMEPKNEKKNLRSTGKRGTSCL